MSGVTDRDGFAEEMGVKRSRKKSLINLSGVDLGVNYLKTVYGFNYIWKILFILTFPRNVRCITKKK